MSRVTLAVIGDVHAHWEHLEPVLERIEKVGVDGILLVGDLGDPVLGRVPIRSFAKKKPYLDSLAELWRRIEVLGKPYLWVPGNHDLPDLAGDRNVDGRKATLAGLDVVGIGGAGPARFGFPYEWDERDIRRRILPACDVLLCHAPPSDCSLDVVKGRDLHVGSEAIRERAEAHTGFLVCGHIHESGGVERIGDCLVLNAGGLGRPWGEPQVGFLRRDDGVDTVWHEHLVSGELRKLERTR